MTLFGCHHLLDAPGYLQPLANQYLQTNYPPIVIASPVVGLRVGEDHPGEKTLEVRSNSVHLTTS